MASSTIRYAPTALAGIAVASAVAIATTYYYWLLIKPRRSSFGRRGKVLTTVKDIKTYAAGDWKGAATRVVYAPFITAVKVTNQEGLLPSLPIGFSSLTALTELDLSGNGLESFPAPILQLKNLRKLSLSRNKLQSLPPEVGRLTTLEDLDLGRNRLEWIPSEIGRLRGLLFLNLMANRLTSVPEEIGQLRVLYRLGLKSNKLQALPASIGDMAGLVELFLTDNELEALPAELGKLSKLFKLQASFNRLAALPPEMGFLPHLELFRIAVNHVEVVPATFAHLDRLAWFSLAGNPACAQAPPAQPGIEHISFADLELGEKLGDGASGDVFAATWGRRPVAFKRFKAETSPDGHSRDEIAVTCALDHPALIKVLAIVEEPSGLVMELLSGRAMADKPNFDSLLRCRWAKGVRFAHRYVVKVGARISGALGHMHSRGVCHGDVYAHNIVADAEGNAVLCDYGASFCYKPEDGSLYEAQEVRAFGLFLSDLVDRLAPPATLGEIQIGDQLRALADGCTKVGAQNRSQFADVSRVLMSIMGDFLQPTAAILE